jgi:oligopeptide transport system substrate-binding protein
VRRVELLQVSAEDAPAWYARDDLDLFNTRFEHLESLANASREDVQLDPPAWLEYFALRTMDPALSRLEFRRALAHAIDRASLERVAPPGAIVATGGMVPPPLQGHTPDIAPAFDPDLARDYLERSDVREGVEILAWGWNRTTHPVVSAVAAGWEDVLGLRFPVRFASHDEYDTLKTSAAILQTGWFPGYPDPEYYLRLLLHSDATDNDGGYSSTAFDSLIERARLERNGRARLELYHEADRLAVADQVAAIPLLYDRNVIFVKPWVSGWWEFGKSWSSFADLVVGEKR